jgi:hypothetical protein
MIYKFYSLNSWTDSVHIQYSWVSIIGLCSMNINILAPKIWAPRNKMWVLQKQLQQFWPNFSNLWRPCPQIKLHNRCLQEDISILGWGVISIYGNHVHCLSTEFFLCVIILCSTKYRHAEDGTFVIRKDGNNFLGSDLIDLDVTVYNHDMLKGWL